MPLDKFVLLIVCVIAAAGVTVALATLLFTTYAFPAGALAIAIPVMLVGYVVWRVIADRIGNKEDDHYDSIER